MTWPKSRWDEWEPKEPTPHTDKTDRRAFVSSVSSSTRPFTGEIDHSDPERDNSPSMKESQKAPLSLTDKTDRSLSQALKLTPDKADRSLLRRAHLVVVPDLSDPEDIQAWLIERAGARKGSGTSRTDADKLAFDQLLWLWCAANPTAHALGRCAACAVSLDAAIMILPDGAQVCDQPDHACLIAYGNGRRTESVGALKFLGIEPPAWWGL